jgi:DNA anti-recombination protein RmuC
VETFIVQEGLLALIGVTAFSAAGFMVVAVLWLRKLRDTVSSSLAEAANQQVRTAQRMNDSLAQVQKQQRNYEQQLQLLSQANTQLRQGLVSMATRLEHASSDSVRGDQTIH